MKCPICNIDLVMSERQGIEIDYCPECRGVWLDRGELDKIIDRSNQAAPSQKTYVEPSYEDIRSKSDTEHGKQDHTKKKRGGGLLGDLFDFGD